VHIVLAVIVRPEISPMNPSECVSIGRASAETGIHERTLRRIVAAGEIDSIRLRRGKTLGWRLVRVADVRAYLARCAIPAATVEAQA
jgi:hypothetical protein